MFGGIYIYTCIGKSSSVHILGCESLQASCRQYIAFSDGSPPFFFFFFFFLGGGGGGGVRAPYSSNLTFCKDKYTTIYMDMIYLNGPRIRVVLQRAVAIV